MTEDERCQSVLKDLINLSELKFKERDALEDIFSSYYSAHEYDIEKYRDTRLRAHFKERFDVRKNMVDWDYGFYVKKVAPHINQREYMAWRLQGLAYETRLASNNVANRTYGSFVPGSDKKTRDKIMVRGFWGDIVQSPYVPFGVEIWKEPENTMFKKQINFQQVYVSTALPSYN